ncbi:hypothetical protein H0H81_007669 [Sphagnurus paluster]|uniref:Protein kinase domain-containing protein n=1 Tax=Sphagnurus paluster TaxID=117069 RepID=A0A9P7KGP1_9AGAR|nr:hypothetical protein H0H81_007669 [Sphagnurus paluster]
MQKVRLQRPRAPPDHLRLQSFQILSRLELIHEFRPWLEHTHYHVSRKRNTPLDRLWDCFAFGAPLSTLLNLLGSPSPSQLIDRVENFDFEIGIEGRHAYFRSFIQRVQMLEAQGRIPYGEVLRSDDFLSDSNMAFAKILRTVYRLLVALEETYPGLFSTPTGSKETRRELVQELIETEQAHLSILKVIFENAEHLSDRLDFLEPCLECFLKNRTRLLQYHERLLQCAKDLSQTTHAYWLRAFALDDDSTRIKVFGAYRSVCINYINLAEFLQKTEFEDLLHVTSPTDDKGYNSLCETVFRMRDISETMDEVGYELRTMHSSRILKGRAYIWSAPDPEHLGNILLDDCIVAEEVKRKQYSVFFFETLLLCCTEGFDRMAKPQPTQSYPIYPWEFGPALRKKSPLDIVYAIPVSKIQYVSCSDTSSIEITWLDTIKQNTRRLRFVSMSFPQWDQWLDTLKPFVPLIHRPSTIPQVTLGDGEELLSVEDEDENGHKLTHARSWSVIARKGPQSDTSSFVNQESNDDFPPISPELLPDPSNISSEILRSPSPLSLNNAILSDDRPPTPPVDDGFGPTGVLDLTGKITREGMYPSAHGGFSDIWKGTWFDGDYPRHVAVKVLRSRIDDSEMEEKMIRRLRRELSIWKNLDHPHILKLYGIASDFGHYSSMVCPWMEQGSLSKYLERSGDILSTSDRLKLAHCLTMLLLEVHSRSIIHGDLTGSNVLITDGAKACLCDFGLSSIIAEFQGASLFTSTIGGAVRWADALFYRLNSESSEDSDESDGNHETPVVSTASDIYSFGSVMLEVLSGRIPYHYIRTDAQVVIELHVGKRPRRPAVSFVSDEQWSFITLLVLFIYVLEMPANQHHTEYAPPVLRAPSPASSIGTVYGEDQTSFSDCEDQLDQADFEQKVEDNMGLDEPRTEEILANQDPLLTRPPPGSLEEHQLYHQVMENLHHIVQGLEENELFDRMILRGSRAALEIQPSTTDIDALMRSMMVVPQQPGAGDVTETGRGRSESHATVTNGPWTRALDGHEGQRDAQGGLLLTMGVTPGKRSRNGSRKT